jgi:hypothetical protein
VVAAFPLAAAKAEDALLKLRELRDNNIFRALSELASGGLSMEQAAKLSKVGGPAAYCCSQDD